MAKKKKVIRGGKRKCSVKEITRFKRIKIKKVKRNFICEEECLYSGYYQNQVAKSC